MTDILIKRASFVLTLDRERRVIRNGGVAIENGEIVAVGKTGDIEKKFKGEIEIDATNKLVLPGLIDGHNHTYYYLNKGKSDEFPFPRGLWEILYHTEKQLTPRDVYVGSLGSFVEMIKHGTTCFAESGTPHHMDQVGEAIAKVGIRGIIQRATTDIQDSTHPLPDELFESTEEALRKGEELVKKWNGAENDRIRAWFSLRAPQACSDELCIEIKKLADRYGAGIHGHCVAYPQENEAVKRKWGMRSIERYHKLGLLGHNLYLVHMGWPNEYEIGLMKENDVKVCHCPAASLHGGWGIVAHGMIPKVIEAGVTVSIGTDGGTASRFLDMVRIMYITACAHKDVKMDVKLIGPHKALEMATIDGARALMWDDKIGAIEPRKRGDIILMDLNRPEWWPMVDVVKNLVYSADGSSVDTVIIDGKLIMKNRKILTVDEHDVMKKVRAQSDDLTERTGIKPKSMWKTV